MENCMKMSLPCISENKDVIISAVIAFAEQLNPSEEELKNIRTAVGEAIDNCIIFAYPDRKGAIYVSFKILKNNILSISIKDKGVGIPDIEKAREPFYTTIPSRCGLGITVMETFMDTKILSELGKGTIVNLKRCID